MKIQRSYNDGIGMKRHGSPRVDGVIHLPGGRMNDTGRIDDLDHPIRSCGDASLGHD